MYVDYTEEELKSRFIALQTPSNIVQWLIDSGLKLKQNPDRDFLVSLEFELTATSPEEAVREMIATIEDHGMWDWSYKVQDINNKDDEVEIYAWALDEEV